MWPFKTSESAETAKPRMGAGQLANAYPMVAQAVANAFFTEACKRAGENATHIRNVAADEIARAGKPPKFSNGYRCRYWLDEHFGSGEKTRRMELIKAAAVLRLGDPIAAFVEIWFLIGSEEPLMLSGNQTEEKRNEWQQQMFDALAGARSALERNP